MADALDIDAAVVTEEVLRARHARQSEVRVSVRAIVTPSGWDYLRANRLRLTRVQPVSLQRAPAVPERAPPTAAAAGTIPEVLPPGAEGGVLGRGRCDHPDRPFGCRTEEFGSGFAEPSSCSQCAVQRTPQSGAGPCGCGGCNRQRAGGEDVEALVQRLTDEIMARLGAR